MTLDRPLWQQVRDPKNEGYNDGYNLADPSYRDWWTNDECRTYDEWFRFGLDAQYEEVKK